MAIIKQYNAQGGSDARYNVGAMTAEERARFDSDGRPLGADLPDQWTWTQGLPGAREMNSEGGGSGGGAVGAAYGQYAAQAKLAYDNAMARIKSERSRTYSDYGFNPEGTQLDGNNLLGRFQQMFRTSAGVLDKSREQALSRGLGRKGLGQRAADEPRYDLDVAAKELSSGYQGILSRLLGEEQEAGNQYQQALLMAMMSGGYGGDGGDTWAEDAARAAAPAGGGPDDVISRLISRGGAAAYPAAASVYGKPKPIRSATPSYAALQGMRANAMAKAYR